MTALFEKRKVEKGLINKGFYKNNDTHVRFTYYYEDGRKGPVTHFSHGTRGNEIGRGLFSTMARQLNLSTSQFSDLIQCEISRQHYEKILIKNRENIK